VRYSSGVVCVSLEQSRLNELRLPPMVARNEDPKGTAYTVSVDYKFGTTTGISAADRALTFNKLADPSVPSEAFYRPGHVFPLCYSPGGVLQRAGHTEASLDLSRLAGLNPGGVLAEVVNDDGSLMLLPGLEKLAEQFGLVLTSVQDIIAYRMEMEGISPADYQ
jgi:3,4-dihydroxy 2-butanone 4-phosphate synthase/GTP cyclohydrolase II